MSSLPESKSAIPHKLSKDGPCKRRLTVELPAEEVSREAAAATRKLARGLRLPGFRKGRVPAEIVRARFASEVEGEAVERLVAKHVEPLLRDLDETPVAGPVLEKYEYQDGEPLVLTARFEVQPDFDLADYRGLSVARPAEAVGDEEMDAALQSLRERMAKLRTVEDRGAAIGDDLLIDLYGKHGEGPEAGEEFERQDVHLRLGNDDIHPDLTGALVESRAGEEKDVTVRYPGDYRTPALAGRTVDYRLHVRAVHERQIPELNDDMARDAGDFADLNSLKQELRQDLESKRKRWVEDKMRDSVARQLLEQNRFEVPDVLVQQEANRRLLSLARELASKDIDPAQAGVDWDKEAEKQRERAAGDLRLTRILDAIAEKEAIEAAEEDVEAMLEKEAERAGKPLPSVRAQWQKEGHLEALNRHLRRDKVLDFLLTVGHIQNESE